MYGAPMMAPMAPMGMAPMAPMMAPMAPMVPMAPMMAPVPMMPMAPPPPPAYYPPPPPPPAPAQPQTIIIAGNNGNSGNGSPCPTCGKDTGNLPRKKVGMVAIIWCIVLSSCSLCCIPLCSDSCKDTELVCVKCQTVKSKVAANCC